MICRVLEAENSEAVAIDTTKIPEAVRDDLAAAILDAVREFFSQPGAQEKHEALLAEWNQRKALAGGNGRRAGA